MEQNIKLSEIVLAGLNLRKEPTQANINKINELLSKIQISTRLSLSDKYVALLEILSALKLNDVEYPLADAVIELECNKIEYGLLPYAINIENDLRGQVDIIICDLLYEIGFVDSILSQKETRDDYKTLEHMIDNIINASNVNRILVLAKDISPERLQDFTKTVAELKDELTGEKLKQMADIAVAASPAWENFHKTVAEQIAENLIHSNIEKLSSNNIDNKEAKTEEEKIENQKE